MIRWWAGLGACAVLAAFLFAAAHTGVDTTVRIVLADGAVDDGAALPVQVFVLGDHGPLPFVGLVALDGAPGVPTDGHGRAVLRRSSRTLAVNGARYPLGERPAPGFHLERWTRRNLAVPAAGPAVYLPGGGARRGQANTVVLVDDVSCRSVVVPVGQGTLPDGRLLAMAPTPVLLTSTTARLQAGTSWPVRVGGQPRRRVFVDVVVAGVVVDRPVLTLDGNGLGVVDVAVPAALPPASLVVVAVAESNTPSASQSILTGVVDPDEVWWTALEPHIGLCAGADRALVEQGLLALLVPDRTAPPIVSASPDAQRRLQRQQAVTQAAEARRAFRIVVALVGVVSLGLGLLGRSRVGPSAASNSDDDEAVRGTPSRWWWLLVAAALGVMVAGLDAMLGILGP